MILRKLLSLYLFVFLTGCTTLTMAEEPQDLTNSEKTQITAEPATFSSTAELNPADLKMVERLPFYEMPDKPVHYAVGTNNYWYLLKADMLFIVSRKADGAHQLLGSVYIPGLKKGLSQRYSMELYKDYLYICIGKNEILVVSVSDASNPQLLGKFGNFENLGAISVANDLLFVTDTRILNVYSLADPKTPGFVTKHDFGGWAYSVSYGSGVYYISSNSNTVCFNFTSDMKVNIIEILRSKWNQCSHIINGNRVILLDADGVRLYEYSVATNSHQLLGYSTVDASYADSLFLTTSFLYFVTSSRYSGTISHHFAVDFSNPEYMEVSSQKLLPGDRFFVGENNELLITDAHDPCLVIISDDRSIIDSGTIRLPGEISGVAVIGNQLYASGTRLYSISLLNSLATGIELPTTVEVPWYWGYNNYGSIWTGIDNRSAEKKLLIWDIKDSSYFRSYIMPFDKKANIHSSFVYEDIILFTSAHISKPGIFMIPVDRAQQLQNQAEFNHITDEPTWDVAVHNGNAFSIVKIGSNFELVVSQLNNKSWEYGIQRISIPEDSYHLKCMDNYVVVENFNNRRGEGLDSLIFEIKPDGHLYPLNFQIPNGFVYGINKGYLFISEGQKFYIVSIENPLHHISEIDIGFGINRFTFYRNQLLVSTDGGLFIYE